MKPNFYEQFISGLVKKLADHIKLAPRLHHQFIKNIVDKAIELAGLFEERASQIDCSNLLPESVDFLFQRQVEQILKEAEEFPHVRALLETDAYKDRTGFAPYLLGMHLWKKEGMKTFYLSPGLTAMLEATDLSGPSFFAKLPYNNFYLQFGSNQYYSDEMPVLGVFISYSKLRPEDNQRTLSLAFVSSGYQAGYHSAYIPMGIIEDNPSDDIKDTLMTTADLLAESYTNRGKDPGKKEFYKELVATVFKFLMYINSKDSDISKPHVNGQELRKQLAQTNKPKKMRQLQRQLEEISEGEHFDVGSRIKIDKSIHKDKVMLGQRSFKYSFRFTVKGHFRSQPCGPGRKDRVLIRIEPYIKGPDGAPIIHKAYDVR